MAVPSSGELSMIGIRRELGNNNYNSTATQYTNVSLEDMSTGVNGTINTVNASSDRPDGSTPHQMSEFYAYDHDAASLTSVSIGYNSDETDEACAAEVNPTYYHDGSSTYPTEGDNLYVNEGGTTEAPTGYYRWIGTSGGAYVEDGVVSSETFSCGRSERRLKYNIEYMGDSPMGIPMYHFNYKDESHGKGRFVGTMVDDLERLGFEDVLINTNDGIFVNYDKIDVPFQPINVC